MAWTGNFKDQIDDLAGTLTVSDDTAIQQWILDGCYDVLTKAIVKSGPEEVWKFVTKSGNVTSVDTDVDEIRTISGVVRNSIFATKGIWGLKDKYADANSIYAATSNSPIWYLDNDNLSIYPAPTGGEPANYYYVPEYSITSWNTGTSSINNYPSEYYYYTMLYAAIQVLHRRMLDSTVPTTPTFEVLPIAPDVPTINTVSLTFSETLADAAIAYSNATAAVINTIDVDSFTGAPTYDAPTTDLSNLEAFSAFSGTLSNLSTTSVSPDIPISPSFTTPSPSLQDATATFTKALTGVPPVYDNPTTDLSDLEAFSAFSGTLANLSISVVPPDTLADLTILATPPTVVGDPTIAYVGTAVPGVADVTGDVPTYTKPSTVVTAVTPDAPTLATITYNGPTTSDVSTAPTVDTIDYELPSASTAFSSRLADFSALTSFNITAVSPDEIPDPAIVSPTVSTVDLANITGSIPSYTLVGVGTSATLGTLATLAIDDLSITAAPPDAFTPQAVTYTPPTAAVASAPNDIADILDVDDAGVTPVVGASSNQPAYLPPEPPDALALTDELDNMKEYIEDEEDNELSAAKGQEISQRIADFNASLSQYQAELGEASGTYQKEAAIYQALVQQDTQNANATNSHAIQNMQKELQRAQSIVQTGSTEHATALQIEQANTANTQAKVMQDAIQTVQALIADNNAKMQEWTQGLAHYQAEVGTEVQEYTNNLNKQTQLWQQTNTTILQEHSQRMQDALNVFNKENAQYQANVQAQMAKFQADAADAMKEADLEIQANIQDYTFELQKWQQSLSQYQAEVNTEVQEFTQKLQMELQSWQTEQANAIQQYQMETADNMKTADIANQAALQQGQADLQVAVRDKDKQLERELQNATNEMQEIIQDNQSKISSYQAELAVYQAKVSAEMQVIGLNVQNELNEFNKESAIYQASTSTIIAKFSADVDEAKQAGDMTLQANIQDYTLELQAFQAEVALYQAEVADTVQEYSANLQKYQAEVSVYQQEAAIETAEYTQNIQKAIQTWQGEQTNRIARYQAEQQDSLNEFNEDNIVYQAVLQKDMAELQSQVQADIAKMNKSTDVDVQNKAQVLQQESQEYQQILGKYTAELQNYQAEVNSEVTQYTQNLQKALQTWQGEQSNRFARYQAEQQDSLGEFNEDNAAFQADVQKQLAEYQADIQIAVKNGDSETQVDITNKAATVQAAIADYDAAVKKYQFYLQKATTDMQGLTQTEQNKLAKYSTELQHYGADLAVYQADSASKLQKYQADLQTEGVGYQWLQDQYGRLKMEYEKAFMIAAPQQQQQAEA